MGTDSTQREAPEGFPKISVNFRDTFPKESSSSKTLIKL